MNSEACRYDHHGYCQEHRLGEPVSRCVDSLVDELRDADEEWFEAVVIGWHEGRKASYD